jgi:hypothetical protein
MEAMTDQTTAIVPTGQEQAVPFQVCERDWKHGQAIGLFYHTAKSLAEVGKWQSSIN